MKISKQQLKKIISEEAQKMLHEWPGEIDWAKKEREIKKADIASAWADKRETDKSMLPQEQKDADETRISNTSRQSVWKELAKLGLDPIDASKLSDEELGQKIAEILGLRAKEKQLATAYKPPRR